MSTNERRALLIAGIVLVLGAIGVVALILRSGDSSPSLGPPPTVAAATPRFPAPPDGSVVFAREDRTDVLALAVVPGKQAATLQASVLGQEGTGVSGLGVSFAVTTAGDARTTPAEPCGAGCYRATVSLPGRPLTVRVRVVRPARTTTWNVTLPTPWPPADASAIVAHAARVWTGLHTLTYRERLSSGPGAVVASHWQVVAPNRLAYQIEKGSQSIIIGTRRWDRPGGGGAWEKSSTTGVTQPVPFWVTATDAHVIGRGQLGGRPVWRVSFFDPRTPGWFIATIDRKTFRTLDLRMFATAHFMHDVYGSFNAPIAIRPPAS